MKPKENLLFAAIIFLKKMCHCFQFTANFFFFVFNKTTKPALNDCSGHLQNVPLTPWRASIYIKQSWTGKLQRHSEVVSSSVVTEITIHVRTPKIALIYLSWVPGAMMPQQHRDFVGQPVTCISGHAVLQEQKGYWHLSYQTYLSLGYARPHWSDTTSNNTRSFPSAECLYKAAAHAQYIGSSRKKTVSKPFLTS